MNDTTSGRHSWIVYTVLLVLFWGVWGAFSAKPAEDYGYPDEMIYIVWAFTMLIPAYFALRRITFDRRPVAGVFGLLIGLTGAGGQLLLFKALTLGPAYLIFPIISVAPAVTVMLALLILRERVARLGAVGVVMALTAIILFAISGGGEDENSRGAWLPLAILICLAWGVQAFLMRLASHRGVNDGTTFGYMTLSALILIPVAFLMMSESAFDYPWQAPALTGVTQVLNAVGALFLVMALSRGKAVVVAPSANSLAPVLTILLSLIVFNTMPSIFSGIGIVLAIVGSAVMVYSEEKHAAEAEKRREATEAASEREIVPASGGAAAAPAQAPERVAS